MSTLSPFESSTRQWFCMAADGDLIALGDCGDYETADEIATDLGEPMSWILSPEAAQEWVNLIASRGITPQLQGELL